MARKTEMETILQIANDPFSWFQTSHPMTEVSKIPPMGHSLNHETLEKIKDNDKPPDAGTEVDDSSNNENPTFSTSPASSKRKKRKLES